MVPGRWAGVFSVTINPGGGSDGLTVWLDPPLPQLLAAPGAEADPVRLARALEAQCREAEIGYCALGPVPAERGGATLALIDHLPDVIAATESVFASVQVGMAERDAAGALRGYVNL